MEKLEIDDDTYEAVIKALVDTDPETLINVVSRVLRDRTDVEYLVTGTPDEHSSVETAQLVVPGVVGTVSGVRNPDRLFTIAIRGQAKYTPISEVEGVLMNPNLINALDDDRYLTEDKERITHGALLFNYYDGYRVEIIIEGTHADPTSEFHQHWDGWFDTMRVDADGTRSRGPTLNGQRLCTIEGARRFGHLRD